MKDKTEKYLKVRYEWEEIILKYELSNMEVITFLGTFISQIMSVSTFNDKQALHVIDGIKNSYNFLKNKEEFKNE